MEAMAQLLYASRMDVPERQLTMLIGFSSAFAAGMNRTITIKQVTNKRIIFLPPFFMLPFIMKKRNCLQSLNFNHRRAGDVRFLGKPKRILNHA